MLSAHLLTNNKPNVHVLESSTTNKRMVAKIGNCTHNLPNTSLGTQPFANLKDDW